MCAWCPHPGVAHSHAIAPDAAPPVLCTHCAVCDDIAERLAELGCSAERTAFRRSHLLALRAVQASPAGRAGWIAVRYVKSNFDALRAKDPYWGGSALPSHFDNVVEGSTGLLGGLNDFGWLERNLGIPTPRQSMAAPASRVPTGPVAVRLTESGIKVLSLIEW